MRELPTNAKEELLHVLQQYGVQPDEIICAEVGREVETEDPDPETGSCYGMEYYRLRLDHKDADRDAFLEALNFDYYAGYGAQHVVGTVWLTERRWLERGEYDGAEWWEFRDFPSIPDRLDPQ